MSINDVVVTDLGADAAPVYVSGDINTNNILDVGETWTYTAVTTVTPAMLNAGFYTNTATATGIPAGGDLDEAMDEETVNATQTISVSNVTEIEGTVLVFQISLSGQSTTDIEFTPALSDGTAIVGTDTEAPYEYSTDGGATWTVWTTGAITIPAGVTSVLFSVPSTDDNLVEGDETFTLTVTNSGTANASASGTGTILDNDAAIIANNDTFGPIDANIGGTIGNVLDNDTFDGEDATTDNVIIRIITPATPVNEDAPVPSIDTETGDIVVPVGTPPGTYEIEYQICEIGNEENCSTAIVTVEVINPTNAIVANDDDAGTVDSQVDNPNILNALANDTLNDLVVERDQITVEILEPASHPGVTLDAETGFVSVAAGTPPGTYTITYEICEVENPSNCDTATITVTVIQDLEETISGVKFNDLNGNGVRDENEPGLAGWLIYLDLNENGEFDENEPNTVSGVDGTWTITGVPLGEVAIREVIPVDSEWVQTFPGVDSNYQHVVTISEDQSITGLLFGNHMPVDENVLASISGYKWHDLDGDGAKDADEPFMANWTIFLDLNNNGLLDAEEPFRLTAADGSFLFEDLQLGAYAVREIMQEGWLQTNPGRGITDPHVVTLSVGGVDAAVTFGNAMPVSITGFVWRDKNANSNYDSQEPLLEGWVVFLDANGNGILDEGEISTLSVEEGYFEFMGLIPGTYNVVAINPTDWVQIYPGSNGFHKFVLRSGETASGDFGIAHVDDLVVVNPDPVTIEGNIWYDYAEDAVWDHKVHLDRTNYVNREVSVEGWQVTLSGTSTSGQTVQMTTFTKPDGSYAFQNVPPGEYRVNREYRNEWVPAFPLLEWDNPLGQYHIIRVNGGYGGLASGDRRIYAGNEFNWIDGLNKGADQLYVGVYLHVDTNGDDFPDTRFFMSGPMSMAWDKSVNRRSKYEIQSIDLVGMSKEFGRIEMSNHRYRKILGELQGQPGDSLVASKMDIPFELTVGGERWILPDSQTPTIEGLVSQMLPYNQKHVSVDGNLVEFYDVFGKKYGRLISMEFMPLYGADFGTNQSVFGSAPDDRYPVIIEDAGARHVLHHYEPHRDLFLGTGFASSQIFVRNLTNAGMGANKLQDIANSGVLFLTPIQAGRLAQIQVETTGNGYLHAWIDLDQNGAWSPDVKLVDGTYLETGVNVISLDIPVGATSGESFARFRITQSIEIDSPSGVLSGGEVEDYLVQLTAAGGTVSGLVWLDRNTNGSFDDTEAGVNGMRVFADINANGLHDQGEPVAFTNADGHYSIFGLPNGIFRIQPDYDGRWLVTNLAGPNFIEGNILDGQIKSGYNFGVVPMLTTIDDDAILPREFGLDQNYPNPFNPTTTIRYRLAEASPVQLTVFDMNGRIVANLVQSTQSAGEYSVAFDASSLASGVYVYRLVAGSHVFTQKLTLIK